MRAIFLILHNIRSAHNVGSILRTADAGGVAKVYLCGCTPTPVDRFGRKRKDIAKVALGAEEDVAWEYREDVRELLKELSENDVFIASVEQHSSSLSYRDFSAEGDVAFVLGEETEGIEEDILKQSDAVVEIPMKGTKESLNVSVAAGIVLFRFVE